MDDSPGYHFVDTNILVYAHDASAGEKQGRAKELLKELWGARTGCLSIQVLQELYVALTTKVPSPMPAEAATLVLEDLSAWRVHTPGVEDVLAAIAIHRRCGLSFWDAMIIRSAACLSCARLWSEDFNPGQVYDGVEVVNPFASA